MRLPYLQVAMELIEQVAPDMAAKLSYPEDGGEARAGWGLLKVIKYVLGRCPDHEPPSANSIVLGPDAARLIARVAGHKGDPEAYVTAGETTQPAVFERVSGGVRLRGLGRYDPAWGKSRPAQWKVWKENRAGTGPEPGRAGNGTGSDSAQQTQTQTQTHNYSPSGSAAAPPAAPPTESAFELLDDATDRPPEQPPARKAATRQKPPDPLHREATELLTAVFESATGEKYGFLAKDAAHVKTLLGLCGRDLLELERRWCFALQPPPGFWPSDVRDLGGLVLHWNKFVARKEPTADRAGIARQASDTQPCPACGDAFGERFGIWGTQLCRACAALVQVDVPQPSAAAVAAWVSAQKGAAA